MVLILYEENYLQLFKCVSFWLQSCCGKLEGWALVNRFNHTSGVTAVTPIDRPKSVCNRCVIEVFGGVFYVVTMLYSVGGGVCHRTESDLFLFVLIDMTKNSFIWHLLINKTCSIQSEDLRSLGDMRNHTNVTLTPWLVLGLK